MIMLTVELHPGGAAILRRPIATMAIANVSDLAPRSDYRIEISEGDNPHARSGLRSCTVFVRDHDRNQSVWLLIAAAIRESEGAVWKQM